MAKKKNRLNKAEIKRQRLLLTVGGVRKLLACFEDDAPFRVDLLGPEDALKLSALLAVEMIFGTDDYGGRLTFAFSPEE